MKDRIGITSYPVNVTPVSGAALTSLRARIDVMEREARQLLMAVTLMKTAINASGNSAGLASCVTALRNWTLSVAMSHSYIQGMLMWGAKTTYALPIALRGLYDNAVDAGIEDASKDASQGRPDPRTTPLWRRMHGG
jgi:hypothetical protein